MKSLIIVAVSVVILVNAISFFSSDIKAEMREGTEIIKAHYVIK